MASRKAKSAAAELDSRASWPPTMQAMEREVPGQSAATWAAPTRSTCRGEIAPRAPVVDDRRQQRPELDDDGEAVDAGALQAQGPAGEDEVAGGGHGDELGEAFEDAEEDRMEPAHGEAGAYFSGATEATGKAWPLA